jgi:membrane protein DedA with SNARE-associated domain
MTIVWIVVGWVLGMGTAYFIGAYLAKIEDDEEDEHAHL